jgi:hypothetical protein
MDEIVAEIYTAVLNQPNGTSTMKYEIIIYKNGNIEIDTSMNWYGGSSPKSKYLTIKDNIPIPQNIIEIFKMLCCQSGIYNEHIINYINFLKKYKEDLKSNYLKENIEINKLNKETQKKIFNLTNTNNQLQKNIVELKQDITVHVDHIKSLKYLNSQLEEKLNKVEKENDQLKLQIIEKKQNNIITFYC